MISQAPLKHQKALRMKSDKRSTKKRGQKTQTKKPCQLKRFKAFITGLSYKMTRMGVIDYFKSFYPSTINFVAKRFGNSTKKISGFGFLILSSEEELNNLLERKLFSFKGRNLKAEPYLNDQEVLNRHKKHLESRRVFVGKIPQSMNSDVLWSALEEGIGPVESAYVVSNLGKKNKKHKGFGYVIFTTPELAKSALNAKSLYLEKFRSSLNFEKPRGKSKPESDLKDFQKPCVDKEFRKIGGLKKDESEKNLDLNHPKKKKGIKNQSNKRKSRAQKASREITGALDQVEYVRR